MNSFLCLCVYSFLLGIFILYSVVVFFLLIQLYIHYESIVTKLNDIKRERLCARTLNIGKWRQLRKIHIRISTFCLYGKEFRLKSYPAHSTYHICFSFMHIYTQLKPLTITFCESQTLL